MSATVTATQRNIKEREAKVLALRAELRDLAKRHPRRAILTAKVTTLLTEIAALKASIHYYKPTPQLATEIRAQRRKVKALTAMFDKAAGARKIAIGKQLRREAKELNEMLAAAKVQQVQTGLKAPLPARRRPALRVVRNPVGEEGPTGEEEAALAAEAGQPPPSATPEEVLAVEEASAAQPHPEFEPSEFSVDEAPEYAQRALAKLDESWDELDEYVNEEGEVWYKNPIVVLGAGVAAWLILRRR